MGTSKGSGLSPCERGMIVGDLLPRERRFLGELGGQPAMPMSIMCEMLRELTIIYEQGADGWWLATIPEVPGAFSQGRTKDEARENVLDALSELMEARRELALKKRGAGSDVESIPLAS